MSDEFLVGRLSFAPRPVTCAGRTDRSAFDEAEDLFRRGLTTRASLEGVAGLEVRRRIEAAIEIIDRLAALTRESHQLQTARVRARECVMWFDKHLAARPRGPA